jgi:hypothetical protein
MDKTISMAVGRSSALQDFDCDVPLPSSNFDGLPGTGDEHGASGLGGSIKRSHIFFVHNIRLAQIISKVYRKLYSAEAVARHTIDSLADVVGELDEELMHWRNTIPEAYRPEHDIEWKPDILHQHALHLHFGYYNCLYNIHRSIFSLPSGPAPGSYFTPDRPLHLLRRNRNYGSAALSIGAARTCLRLVLALREKVPGVVDLRVWSICGS